MVMFGSKFNIILHKTALQSLEITGKAGNRECIELGNRLTRATIVVLDCFWSNLYSGTD